MFGWVFRNKSGNNNIQDFHDSVDDISINSSSEANNSAIQQEMETNIHDDTNDTVHDHQGDDEEGDDDESQEEGDETEAQLHNNDKLLYMETLKNITQEHIDLYQVTYYLLLFF